MPENRLVKKKHLQEVAQHLWDEAKKKYVHHVSLEVEGVGEAKKNVLKSYKNNQPTVVADHVVQQWDDLEYTSKSKNVNVFNKNTDVIDGRYIAGGTTTDNVGWKIAVVPCKKLDTITIVKNANDSTEFALFDTKECTGNKLQNFTVQPFDVDGSFVYTVVPNEATLEADREYYLAVNMKKENPNKVDENLLMVFNTDVTIIHDDIPREYVPYSTHGSKFINGEEVVMSFDSKGGRLESTAVGDAIREIDDKMVTEWIDLEHVSETYSFFNLMSHKDIVVMENTLLDRNNGTVATNPDWTSVIVPITKGKRYFLHNRRSDSQTSTANVLGSNRFCFINNPDNSPYEPSMRVDASSYSNFDENTINGKKLIPIGTTTREYTHLGFVVNNRYTDINPLDELMIWEESQTPQIADNFRYVKDNIVNQVEIDGSKVTIRYPEQLAGINERELKAILEELATRQVQGVTGVVSIQGKDGVLTLEIDRTTDENNIIFNVNKDADKIEFGKIPYMTEQQINEYDAIFV